MSQTLRETASNILPKIPEEIPAVIKAPETPPKAKMGEPEFENLTNAEKLNDSRYRSSIYRTYPNEPTCGCENERKKSYIESNCPGGCTNRCCSSSRGKSKKRRNSTNFFRSNRLRGGGEGVGNLDFSDLRNNGYKRGYSSRLNVGYTSNFKFRLGGGGGGQEEEETNINKKKRYYCPHKQGRNSAMLRENNQEIIKKSCLEIDCLLKKYEDAQEFVESLGKVPGLAGLGLADPSESPYFGRSKEDDDDESNDSFRAKIDNYLASPNHKTNPNCPDVCNKKFSYNKSMYAGRLGVIREVVPDSPNFNDSVIPGTKIKKKDEKVEKEKEEESSLVDLEEGGPCGDPKCRSKRKKINVEGEGNSILKGSSKHKVHGNNSKSDNKDKERNKYIGASEDQNASSSMKMVRKIGKFVYSAGDTYPRLNCGHKTCVGPVTRVPPNMGWMWRPEVPLGRLKPRIGWKPGAINARLRRVLHEVKDNFWQDERPKSAPSRSRKGSAIKNKRSITSIRKMTTNKPEIVEEEWKEPPPTLHIHRKDGVYYVTMYPIKQDTMDVPKLEEPTKPLQFKIMKNRDDVSDVSSSTASDMEIEFSPPAAVNRYRKKPDVIHVETQVKQQEILDAYKPPGPKKIEKKAGKEKKAKK